ncbi:MAG: Ig-like domain-containing protein, partial [Verrucomicrobiales bacterium]
SDQNVHTARNIPVEIELAGVDVEGDLLSYEVIVPPSHGSLTGTAPELIYTPSTDYVGIDSFSYVVDDGQTSSSPVTVSIQAGVDPNLVAGYDFDDGSGNATVSPTLQHPGIDASDFGVGAGLVTRFETGGNSLAEVLDAQGYHFGTANPVSFGGAQSNFGFTDMNNANDLSQAIDEEDYMVFTVTPQPNYQMDLNTFSFRKRANSMSNSAERWALFSSVGGFAEGAEIAVGQTTTEASYVDNVIDLPDGDFEGLDESVTFRLYVYGGDEPWSSATIFDKVLVSGQVGLVSDLDPYSEWANRYGLTGESALPDSDGENGGIGDGYSNFAEYALGMNPTLWDAGSRESHGTAIDGGERYFEYLYYRRADYESLGISYQVMESSGLDDFGVTVDDQIITTVGPEVDGFETVRNRYLIEAPKKFVRLRVSQE